MQIQLVQLSFCFEPVCNQFTIINRKRVRFMFSFISIIAGFGVVIQCQLPGNNKDEMFLHGIETPVGEDLEVNDPWRPYILYNRNLTNVAEPIDDNDPWKPVFLSSKNLTIDFQSKNNNTAFQGDATNIGFGICLCYYQHLYF
eukprot:TRINITY_DN9447_c0_g6_i2.p3 TRINITY_DN9447_c0_g6~~TRINITY_DN9447_c0_g6_i2.p3  ORF type:complete len:143 (-),score=1.10 TRINITY_DN9447_c0_g6_i2:195-623(-)